MFCVFALSPSYVSIIDPAEKHTFINMHLSSGNDTCNYDFIAEHNFSEADT